VDIGPPQPTVVCIPLDAFAVLVGAILNEISLHVTPPKAVASLSQTICHLVYQSTSKFESPLEAL